MKPRQSPIGDKNIVGVKIARLRQEKGIKQKDFLAQLQTMGMDVSPTSLSRLEGQHRLVQDYEIVIIAKVLNVSYSVLLDEDV